MVQVNFLHEDVGAAIPAINGNTTSAITAGDIVYASGPSTSPFGTTVPAGVDYDEFEVEPVKFATAAVQGKFNVGVAAHDAAAGSQVSFYNEGLALSPVIDTTGHVQAGRFVRAAQGETTAGVTNAGTTSWGTTAQYAEAEQSVLLKVGFAITAANVDGDYVLWKVSK